MANSLVLAWNVDVAGTPYGPVQATAALGAVPLYDNPITDPVLGQLFGLIVESDVTAPSGPSTVTRTLTLKMTLSDDSPSFPCHPRTATPPQPPYPLRRAVTLTGELVPTNGSVLVATTAALVPELVPGTSIQFLSQKGVFYTVFAVTPTTVTLTAPFTGLTGPTPAFKEVPAPVTRAAIYSTSPLDTDAVATTPAIPAGPGAQAVILEYEDSTGASFGVVVPITGRRPAPVVLDPASKDIAVVIELGPIAFGSFGNSVGQITLCSLDGDLPPINPGKTTPKDFRGRMTDEGQLLIDEHLVYVPPSYFALTGQVAATPPLAGDFLVSTGSPNVPTTSDQTGALVPGDTIEFAYQLGTLYTVSIVNPKQIVLTTPFTGFDLGPTPNSLMPVGGQATDVRGATTINRRTGAWKLNGTGAPPSDDALKGTLGQFVQTATAVPPPNPPFPPATIPTPTFLSDLFTQTLQLALAVPVKPQAITLI